MKKSILLLFMLIPGPLLAMDFTLGLRAGTAVSPVPAGGAEMFLHFGDLAFGISYVTGATEIKDMIDDDSDVSEVEQAEATAELALFEMQYTLFWGLNGRVGIGQRTMGLNYIIRDINSDGTLEGTLEGTSLVISHSVGFEWHFDWFYIALDGAGIAYPGQTTATAEMETNGDISGDIETEITELEEAAYDMSHVLTKQLFLFRFGLLF